jgi:hypothetical protein
MFSDLWYRLRVLVRRTASENELDAELNFHFDRQVEKYMQAGMTREEAVRQARMAFGGLAQVKEDCRRAWGTALFETLAQDIGYGALLVRNPGFSAAALLTLTLGIGATTAIFSLVDAVLLRPLPYRDSQRLVEIYEDHSGRGVGLKYDYNTPGGFADLKRQTQVFQDVAAIDGGNQFALQAEGGEPCTLTEESVTWNLLRCSESIRSTDACSRRTRTVRATSMLFCLVIGCGRSDSVATGRSLVMTSGSTIGRRSRDTPSLESCPRIFRSQRRTPTFGFRVASCGGNTRATESTT